MQSSVLKIAVRRIVAFCIDYIVIAIYIGGLIFVNLKLLNTSLEPQTDIFSKARGHAIAFVTLTFPVWLYLTAFESRTRAATIGKRVMNLRVVQNNSETASFAQIALRNALKLLPWEAAHIAIWYAPGQSFIDPMPIANLTICILANCIAIGFAITLFVKDGRSPYDRLSKTMVTF